METQMEIANKENGESEKDCHLASAQISMGDEWKLQCQKWAKLAIHLATHSRTFRIYFQAILEYTATLLGKCRDSS